MRGEALLYGGERLSCPKAVTSMSLDPTETEGFRRELTALIPRMRAFGRTMCGNPTAGDDLAQEGLLKAWTAQGSYTRGTNLKAWVYMIMRNQFLSLIHI